jgi:hypothetical protein
MSKSRDKRVRRPSKSRIGGQPPRFNFFLNPYADVRFTTCPKCSGKTRQRKLPLVIHVDDGATITLNKTCRYCPSCDLLIAHQDEIEGFLTAFFTQHNPDVIGNDYLVLGTTDRKSWLRGTKSQLSGQEMLDNLHDFKNVWQFEPGGYGWQG